MPRAKSNERVLTETLLSTLYDKDDLQDLLDNVDLPVSGKKAVLIDRLIDESDYTPYELLDYFYKVNLQDICYDYDLPCKNGVTIPLKIDIVVEDPGS